jgi:hypothetical protein
MAYILVSPAGASRQEIKTLRALIPRLKELGVKLVVGVPEDPAATWLAAKLHVPLEQWNALKPFHWGKSKERIIPENPIVPVPGGDSRASFQKRLDATREKLGRANSAVFVGKADYWKALLGADLKVRRVYEV